MWFHKNIVYTKHSSTLFLRNLVLSVYWGRDNRVNVTLSKNPTYGKQWICQSVLMVASIKKATQTKTAEHPTYRGAAPPWNTLLTLDLPHSTEEDLWEKLQAKGTDIHHISYGRPTLQLIDQISLGADSLKIQPSRDTKSLDVCQ